jgi:hypothetical protein
MIRKMLGPRKGGENRKYMKVILFVQFNIVKVIRLCCFDFNGFMLSITENQHLKTGKKGK